MENCDLVIIGGGLGGCIAALHAKKLGMNVVIVEERTFLGHEIAGKYQTYIPVLNKPHISLLDFSINNEIFPQGKTKMKLLSKMREAEIPCLFMSSVGALAININQTVGVMLANEFGTQVLIAGAVLDTTSYVVKMAEQQPYFNKSELLVTYNAEIENISTNLKSLKIDDVKINILPGAKNENSFILSCSYPYKALDEDYFEVSIIENNARLKMYDILVKLRTLNGFEKMSLANLATEVFIDDSDFCFNTKYKNFYFVKNNLKANFTSDELHSYELDIEKLVDEIVISHIEACDYQLVTRGGIVEISEKKAFCDSRMPVKLETVKINPQNIKTAETDLAVAGLGTGGVLSVLATDNKDIQVIGIEHNKEIGGTRTAGHVCGYYHGYRGGITKITDDEIVKISQSLFPDKTGSATDRCARIIFYHNLIQQSNLKFLFSTCICDVVMKNNKLCGIIAVNQYGIIFINSRLVIDTTGEATVAAFGDAEFEYGDPIDYNTQTYSQWGLENRKCKDFRMERYLQDIDVIDTRYYSEINRACYLSVQTNSEYYFSNMITVRESRRIIGEAYLTIEEILAETVPKDLFACAYSDVDSHGLISSGFAKLGYRNLASDLRVRIPYGCFVPKGVDGILVGGKALSGERDAVSLCRMTADIQNAGYALGIAAVEILINNYSVRELDITKIQNILNKDAVIAPWAYTTVMTDYNKSIEEKVTDLLKNEPYGLCYVIMTPPGIAIPYLKNKFAEKNNVQLAKTLAWFGENDGADLLLEKLYDMQKNEVLNPKEEINPEKGILYRGIRDEMTDYWEINGLIYLISKLRDKRLAPVLAEMISKSEAGGDLIKSEIPYYANRKDTHYVPFYDRLLVLAEASAAISDKILVKHLKNLLEKPYIGGHFTKQGSISVNNYFSALLEIKLAYALKECGGGKELLELYSEDEHISLSNYAVKCLYDSAW